MESIYYPEFQVNTPFQLHPPPWNAGYAPAPMNVRQLSAEERCWICKPRLFIDFIYLLTGVQTLELFYLLFDNIYLLFNNVCLI